MGETNPTLIGTGDMTGLRTLALMGDLTESLDQCNTHYNISKHYCRNVV